MKRFRFFFAWYDLWVGAYYDRKERCLYICLLPCCVVQVDCTRYCAIIGPASGKAIGWGKRHVLMRKSRWTQEALRSVSKKEYLRRTAK